MNMIDLLDEKPFATVFDILLIGFVFYAAFNWGWFVGGFGWFILLGLSPQAWK